MSKALLKNKLIDFQKQILTLSQEIQTKERAHQEQEEGFILEILSVIDSFENVFKNVQEKEASFDKSARRAMKSYKAICRKLLRILEAKGVEQIEFPDGKAVMGLCKVIETKAADDSEDGTIIAVIRNGYRFGERVLRPAEVVTVANKKNGG
ncbi:MAG: nucleotide exchange factor GrpE [Gammaproteobacteria bacterium]|nr:nucleotide exchange factor GrpE [Gammaproteobacteria bacterium]